MNHIPFCLTIASMAHAGGISHRLQVVPRASASVQQAGEGNKPPPPIIKHWRIAATLGAGIAIKLLPAPAGATPQAWTLLAVFVSTVTGIVLQPLPLGFVALCGLGACVLSGTLPFSAAFASMSAEVPWLIVTAMFLSSGLSKSGLGSRVAYSLVVWLGRSVTGLAYSLVLGEAILAAAIPSVAARSGGIFLPLARSLSEVRQWHRLAAHQVFVCDETCMPAVRDQTEEAI